MTELIIVGLITGVPLVVAITFRVHAVYLFVGVTAGSLLVQQFADDAALVLATVVKDADVDLIARVALQALPVVLMLLFARHTAGKNAVFHIVPVLFTCVMFGILMLQVLPPTVSGGFYASDVGAQVKEAEGLIIGATAVSQLLLIWSNRQPKSHKKGHGKHAK